MGTGTTIKTGGGRNTSRTQGGGISPSYYDKNQTPYQYGIVKDINYEDGNSVIFTPFEDRIGGGGEKLGIAYPFYPNKTKIPDTGSLIPLLRGPARNISLDPTNQYDKSTYYLDPIDFNQSVNGNIIGDPNQQSSTTPNNTYKNNEIGVGNVNQTSFSIGTGWENIAANFISLKEGFSNIAYNDEGSYRAGFGTDKKLVNGQLIPVTKSTTFTKQEAIDTLSYQLKNEYGPILVGQLGKTNWDKLNNNQKAAIASMGYNCGPYFLTSRSYGKDIKNSIINNNYQSVAKGINNGPTTGAKSHKVYPDLVKRRNDEANLFLS